MPGVSEPAPRDLSARRAGSALFRVSGRVQAVGFRAATAAAAQRLGLAGHARNLPDGRVEVLAVGPAEAVDALAAWLHGGPPLARVDAVERLDAGAAAAAEAAATGIFRPLR